MVLVVPTLDPPLPPEYGPPLVVHWSADPLEESIPEKAFQAASFVAEKYDDADAVNVSPPTVSVDDVMNGEGGKRAEEIISRR